MTKRNVNTNQVTAAARKKKKGSVGVSKPGKRAKNSPGVKDEALSTMNLGKIAGVPKPVKANLFKQAVTLANEQYKSNTPLAKELKLAWALTAYVKAGGKFVYSVDTTPHNKVGASQDNLEIVMAKKLSAEDRKALPDADFVFPDKKEYPIPDVSHAINALSRATQSGDEATIAEVKKAVHKKFPFLKKDEKAKAGVANAVANLQTLNHILNTFKAAHKFGIKASRSTIQINVNADTKLTLAKKALYLEQAKFKDIISKFSKSVSKSKPVEPATEHSSPTILEHHKNMMKHHLDQAHFHYGEHNRAVADKVANEKSNPEVAKNYGDIAHYHAGMAAAHTRKVQDHLPHVPNAEEHLRNAYKK